jgi:hypothetical protein
MNSTIVQAAINSTIVSSVQNSTVIQNVVAQGFSRTNRWLIYTSMMLSPAQFLAGVGSQVPFGLGFLGYNLWTQVLWYRAIRAKQLHALSLSTPAFSFFFCVTYCAGLPSGNPIISVINTLGTIALLILNDVSVWTSWVTNMPEGFGEYRFFFFGWRTLGPGWHRFFQAGQVFSSIEILVIIFGALSFMQPVNSREDAAERLTKRYSMILVGAAGTLIAIWPLIMWTELIVAHNHIESATDYISVWLFIAQVVAMLIPI